MIPKTDDHLRNIHVELSEIGSRDYNYMLALVMAALFMLAGVVNQAGDKIAAAITATAQGECIEEDER